jgi:hypothetical protein
MEPNVDDYTREEECIYKDERYSARDNGAVWRHSCEGKKPRPTDCQWTFGKPNDKTGYMEIGSARVHIIVAMAFHGVRDTKIYVVDHIDTNRRNNRLENLRWLTRLENVLLNPISRKKIEFICGCSAEEFLENPEIYREMILPDTGFGWMRTVTPEEGVQCLKNLLAWAASDKQPSGGSMGEWIYQSNTTQNYVAEVIPQKYMLSLTSGAVQRNLTPFDKPVEYPSTPKVAGEYPLITYANNLPEGAIFFRNHNGPYMVVKSGFSADGQSLYVLTKAGYAWIERDGDYVPVLISELPKTENDFDTPVALTEVTYEDGLYIHEKMGFGFHPKEEIEKQFAELTQDRKK